MKIIIHKSKPLAIITWRGLSTPDFNKVVSVAEELKSKFKTEIHYYDIETNDSDYAVVMSGSPLTDFEARMAYINQYEIEAGFDLDKKEWDKVFNSLFKVVLKTIEEGGLNSNWVDYINNKIVPLLKSYERGERAKELYIDMNKLIQKH